MSRREATEAEQRAAEAIAQNIADTRREGGRCSILAHRPYAREICPEGRWSVISKIVSELTIYVRRGMKWGGAA